MHTVADMRGIGVKYREKYANVLNGQPLICQNLFSFLDINPISGLDSNIAGWIHTATTTAATSTTAATATTTTTAAAATTTAAATTATRAEARTAGKFFNFFDAFGELFKSLCDHY